MPPVSTSHFLFSAASIVLIDLLLAGDNALVIAMVVRKLAPRQRRFAIGAGAGFAVLLRVVLTFLAAQLLRVPYVQIAGGVLILWIAVKVLADAADGEADETAPGSLAQAIAWIVAADITMSTDNILAVAGASEGSFALIAFGLCLSIPFVVASSRLLSALMDKHAIVLYAGAAILGRVGAQMILTDPAVATRLHASDALRYAAEAAAACAVIAAGRLRPLAHARATESAAEPRA